MIELAMSGFVMLSIVVLVYTSYLFFVLRRKKLIANFQNFLLTLQKSNSNLENVSVIISTYNEAGVIGRKIDNISELNYPKEKMEIIVLEDASTDGTADIAERKLQEKRLFGRVIRNSSRMGLNRSLNAAVAEAKNNFVCITDSDVLLEKDALKNSVSVLQGFKDAGGVTGRIQPVFEGDGVAQTSESSYRGFYHESMLAESSLHSAFPGNGPLIVYNKSRVPLTIPVDYGSTDGNIAINIIRSGLRFIYVPNAVVFEPAAENLGQQRLQKIRRAKRLLQVFIHNSDINLNGRYGDFGRKVFPLKLLILGFCPLLMFAGLSLIVASIVMSGSIPLYVLLVVASAFMIGFSSVFKRLNGLLSSFVLHQLYLIAGLLFSFRKSVYWKTIDRKARIRI